MKAFIDLSLNYTHHMKKSKGLQYVELGGHISFNQWSIRLLGRSMGPVGLGGGRTTERLTGPGGRFTRQGYGASRSRRRQDHREANRSRRRQVHKAGVWGQ